MGGYKWFILLLLIGCSASSQHIVDADARVIAFHDVFPKAEYSETTLSGANLAAMADVVARECPNATQDAITRATYHDPAATLVIYLADNKIQCVVSRLNEEAFIISKGNRSAVDPGTIVTVNGEAITQADLEEFYASLNPNVAAATSQAAAISALIDQTLLLQAAKDITIDTTTVQEELQRQASAAGYNTVDEFAAARSTSRALLEDAVRLQLQVNAYLASDKVTVTQDAARQFYLDNPNLFLIGEQVKFRQIFISFNKSGSIENAGTRLQEVLDANSDFCELVRQYSDDRDSLGNCGEYIVSKGAILPEIETALFALQDGASTVVESDNGYHIILRVSHTEPRVISYQEAQQELIGALRQSLLQRQLQINLIKLRAQAQIIDYT